MIRIEECRKSLYPHNHRRRTTDGFYCDDCGHFFSKDSEDYIRTETMSSMYFACWNVRADFILKEEDVPISLVFMLKRIKNHETLEPFSMPISDVERLISDAKAVISEHTEYDESLHSIVIGTHK